MNWRAKKASEISLETLKGWPKEKWHQYAVEPKIDGLRLLMINGKPTSINNKPYYNLNLITKAVKANKNLKGYVLDGELISTDWNSTMSLARSSETKVDDRDAIYVVFDILPYDEYKRGKFTESYKTRRDLLRELDWFSPIELIPSIQPLSYNDFMLFYRKFVPSQFEGVVLKRLDSLYDFKRNQEWLKVKPTYTADVKITGMNPGRGKYEGMLGSLKVIYKGNKTDVGGMNDAMRYDMWNNPAYYIGKMCEVEYKSITRKGRLYAPAFKRMRPDKIKEGT